MQTAIVILIVALAALYMARRFWRTRQGASCSGCGGSCGCSGGQGKAGLEPFKTANRNNPDGQAKTSCPSCNCGSQSSAGNQNS